MDTKNLEESILKIARAWHTAAELSERLKLSVYGRRSLVPVLKAMEKGKKLEGQIRKTGVRGRPAREFRRKV